MKRKKKTLNRIVFYPPLAILVITICFGIYAPDNFLAFVSGLNKKILEHFGGFFTWSSFSFLILIAGVYFSPLGSKRIGGKNAKPLLNKWSWFAISICTTTASAIMFWACAEPLYHLNTPPKSLGFGIASPEAAEFAMSTLFMHWSFTPYAIYTVGALVFSYAYYNLQQPFSVSSMLYPILKDKAHGKLGNLADVICLYALILGMSASLGAGLLAITGGLQSNLGIEKTPLITGMVCVIIVATFIISSATGLQKGIQFFSNINVVLFIILATTVFVLGPTYNIISSALVGAKDYIIHFLPRSLDINSGIDSDWYHNWTVYYLANWFAWAPITSLFLGRLGVGYTIKQFILFNLISPSLFTIVWMSVFGGTTIHFDMISGGALYQNMQEFGEGIAMYTMFDNLPLGSFMSFMALAMLFIAFITAADSNVSAMSALSSKGISPRNPESAIWIKVVWGVIIGATSFIMLSSAGIDGIRILSVLGGFPSMFLVILAALGLLRLVFTSNNK